MFQTENKKAYASELSDWEQIKLSIANLETRHISIFQVIMKTMKGFIIYYKI